MVVLITGANKGIGFATAKLFYEKGYSVILCGRNEERLKNAREKLGENAKILLWDISDVSVAKQKVREAHSLFGKIDVFINNAGIVVPEDNRNCYKNFFQKTEEGWDATMNVNLKGTFFALQAQAEYMADNKIQGNIVTVCSEMGFRPADSPYGVSKWGVRGMIMGAGKLLAPLDIVVNGIAPGETATEILLQEEGVVKEISSPRGIQATPDEIAEGIYFLANSRNIIGTILVSDGGRSLK